MIKDIPIKIKLGRNSKYKYYESIGYNINCEYLMVDYRDLSIGSSQLVESICDYCGISKSVKYKEYLRNISFNSKFSCSNKCGCLKKKEISLKKYGVDSPSMLTHIKEKVKITNLEKYGVEHIMQSDIIKSMSRNTNIQKYGVDNPMKCDIIKDRLKKSIINKYGIENVFQLEETKNKTRQTNLEKYGVEYLLQSDYFKNKFKNTFIRKYGVEFPLQVIEFSQKAKLSNRKTNEYSGRWIPLSRKSDFEIYKREIRKYTRLNIKNVIWNGIDYYDGEYIKDNFIYHHLNNNYPTIDHKISIFNGFMLNKSIEEISNDSNLCWTKRIINITKNKY